ncbi:MAG: hypothetical protein IKA76_07740 [Clostridia bacterium]|nr:hypothetical protein [Clostridia bacterium]
MNDPAMTPSTGFLVVKVSTAQGAIPLENATVNIRGGSAEDSGILYSLRTDRDGKTSPVALATPSLSQSETPQGDTPYSVYHVDVFLDGYQPLFFHNVPIFPSIISVQPAIMIPDPASPL